MEYLCVISFSYKPCFEAGGFWGWSGCIGSSLSAQESRRCWLLQGSASLKPWQLSGYLLASLLLPLTLLRLVRENRGWNKCGKHLYEVLPGLYHSCRKTQIHSQLTTSPTKLLQKNVDFFLPDHCQSLLCSPRCFTWSWSSPPSPESLGIPFQMEI